MVEFPKLLVEVFGKHTILVEEILKRAINDGFDVSDESRHNFYVEYNTTEYLFYKLKAQLEHLGIVNKKEGKLFISPYFDLDFSKQWREWLK